MPTGSSSCQGAGFQGSEMKLLSGCIIIAIRKSSQAPQAMQELLLALH